MSARYAERTEVPSDRSRSEIERTLRRYGATAFAYGWDHQAATVMFEISARRIMLRLPMPDRDERRFTHTPARGQRRDESSREREYEQAVRQKWRALSLVIKAKLEAVEAGITTIEGEFLAQVVMPDGRTVGQHTAPAIAVAYESGRMPALLPGPIEPAM